MGAVSLPNVPPRLDRPRNAHHIKFEEEKHMPKMRHDKANQQSKVWRNGAEQYDRQIISRPKGWKNGHRKKQVPKKRPAADAGEVSGAQHCQTTPAASAMALPAQSTPARLFRLIDGVYKEVLTMSTGSQLSIEPGALIFNDEYFHNDANFDVRHGEKLAAGRKRLGQRYGRTLLAMDQRSRQDLGQLLIQCDVGRRCGSGACPKCGVAVQRWLGGELLSWLEHEPIVAMLTVIPTPRLLAPASLKDDDIDCQREWLRDVLDGAGLGRMPFVAALDISLNSFGPSGPQPFWQPHWCGFTAGRSTTTLTAMLSAAAGKAEHFGTPIVTKPVRSRLAYVLSYGFKTRFVERVRTGIEEEKIDLPIDHQHRRFGPLMKHLHVIGLMNRIYAQNVELELR
jgi:hypothetical protein